MPFLPTLANSPREALASLVGRVFPEIESEALQEFTGYAEEAEGDVAHWKDQPVSFGKRRFQSRPVRRDDKI